MINEAARELRQSWVARTAHFDGFDGVHRYRVETQGGRWRVFVDGDALRSLDGRHRRFVELEKAFRAAEKHAAKLNREERQLELAIEPTECGPARELRSRRGLGRT